MQVRESAIIIKSSALVGVSVVVNGQRHTIKSSDLMPKDYAAENYQKRYLAMDKGIYALSLFNGHDWLLQTRVFLGKGQTKEIFVHR